MYIRKGTLDRTGRSHGDESVSADRIESRLHTGTTNLAIAMTIPDALDFQATIGVDNKGALAPFARHVGECGGERARGWIFSPPTAQA
jgi:isopenicillin-N epimerase